MARIDRLMRGRGGEVDLPDRDSKVSPSGGVKIKDAEILVEHRHPTRYAFRLVGSAPKNLVLTDLVTMLEARFRGELGTALVRSRDEAVQRLTVRMGERAEKLKAEEDKYRAMAAEVEAKKAEYERTADEIRGEIVAKASQDLVRKRADLEQEIKELDREVRDLRNRRSLVVPAVLQTLAVHPLTERAQLLPAQITEIADNLVSEWRESLEDYENPMLSEYGDLASLVTKVIEKVIDRVNDAHADYARNTRSSHNHPVDPPSTSPEDPISKIGSSGTTSTLF